MLLIGWDDAKGAFLCKNSWGPGGPNGDGTFWIAYAGHAYDLGFGMANFSLEALGCATDAECDDNAYCNGAETCEANDIDIDELEQLFPDGYHRGAVKIAGLRLR